MIEWEDDDTTRAIEGDWEVSWDNKRTVFSARDTPNRGINRLYFLLSAGERVPGTVQLKLVPTADAANTPSVVWKANPLPAIFPAELGASAREAGKKGVLHTIWAKRRLQVLASEITDEDQKNAEGAPPALALQEKEWIEENFGVQVRPTTTQPNHRGALKAVQSPGSPRSPESGRLMEKLKGLKLNTTANDRPSERPVEDDHEPYFSNNLNPLSPQQSDVAVSSFGTFATLTGMSDPRTLAAKPPQNPSAAPTRRIASQMSTNDVIAQQHSARCASLDALATAGQAGLVHDGHDEDREDDLFALPISPRSPDMGRSPFSFGAADTRRYVGAD